jgi:hypothetical protein
MARVEGFEPGQSGQQPVDVNGDPLGVGVWGDSDLGVGVFGSSGALPPNVANVPVDLPAGVEGHCIQGPGVVGRSVDGDGVQGESLASLGVLGRSVNSSGVLGVTFTPTPGEANGVFGVSTAQGNGVVGFVGSATGVVGNSVRGTGVRGLTGEGNGVVGESFGNSPNRVAAGVLGSSGPGDGVRGTSSRRDGSTGVAFGPGSGASGLNFSGDAGSGVSGTSILGTGVEGVSFSSDPNAAGVLGQNAQGFAGVFLGDVRVTGALAKGGGGFIVDHPLDPENRYLSHSFVESPDMLNVYSGNVTTDANGEAGVMLPDYFEAANQDFRYQLTVIGDFAQAVVAEEIRGNRFTIRTDHPRVRVSWQVTGVRQDAWAVANRITVEQEKVPAEKGRYLHPELWGQPAEARIHRGAQREDLVRRIRELVPEQLGPRVEQHLGPMLRGRPADQEELRGLLSEARWLADETSTTGRERLGEQWQRVEELVQRTRPMAP